MVDIETEKLKMLTENSCHFKTYFGNIMNFVTTLIVLL